jgi:hypothetical protein
VICDCLELDPALQRLFELEGHCLGPREHGLDVFARRLVELRRGDLVLQALMLRLERLDARRKRRIFAAPR